MANSKRGEDRRDRHYTRGIIEEALRQGKTVDEACRQAGRTTTWYYEEQKRFPEWKVTCNTIREAARAGGRPALPDFPEFCEEYLGMKLWDHQLTMFDVLEGREPRWCPLGIVYEPSFMGNRRVIINVPPSHAKTMTVSIAYVLWKILGDKSMSVLIISKTAGFASKILWAIKNRLTSGQYAKLQAAFGPVGGFKETSEKWTNTQVYLWGEERDGQDKDPTIEATGIGGQIYGARAKLILIDDAIVLSNASQWQAQQDWIRQEVASRIGPDDQLIVVGTRVAPVDLYRELRNPDHYHDQQVPWTYLGLPAVLDYADKVDDWVTLWPRTDIPFSDGDSRNPDGSFDRWTGKRMARIRNEVGPMRWNLVYMQQDVSEDSTFDPMCVRGSIDGRRGAGQALAVGVPGGPDKDWNPFTIIGVDPAIAGVAGITVLTVDRRSSRMWVMDAKALKAPSPTLLRKTIMELGDKYDPSVVVIEENAYQRAILFDEELKRWAQRKGISLKAHHTGSNKADPMYGVAAMSPLFGWTDTNEQGVKSFVQGSNLISLPNQSVPGIKVLVDELLTWQPQKQVKHLHQDVLVSLWFCVYYVQQLVRTNESRHKSLATNRFTSRHRAGQRVRVSLSDIAAARAMG